MRKRSDEAKHINEMSRVIPELNISNLRLEIEAQLDNSEFPLPESYTFIRNVGRHFALVSTNKLSFEMMDS